ncbi:hypothetical protein [Pseudoalteromonas sp. S979]|nr:hypothetical protein [Pseudoalteromonas sp. S979]
MDEQPEVPFFLSHQGKVAFYSVQDGSFGKKLNTLSAELTSN